MLSFHDFIILILAAWYLTYVVTKSTLTATLRGRFSFTVLKCPLCLIFWVFAFLWIAWLTIVLQPVVWILAGAGAALNLTAWTGSHHLWGTGE